MFCSAAGSNSKVFFAAAGLTIAGLSGLLVAGIGILPFGLHFVCIGDAMVIDVMFGLWLCVLCQICQIFANWRCGKRCCHLANFCFLQVLCCTKESINVWVEHFCDCLFPKNWWKLKYLFYVSYSLEPNIQG